MKRVIITQSGGDTVHDVHTVSVARHVIHVPEIGKVVMDQAAASNIATMSFDGGPEHIALLLVRRACDCGCGELVGRGLCALIPPEEARRMAGDLIAHAEKLEVQAATAATAAIARAARK